MPAEQFIFVRHGETRMNRELRCQGRIDIELNETGLAQARETAARLAELKIDKIYVSPLKRARQSADAIAAALGIEPVVQDWLLEVNHGAVEGMDRAEADRAFPGLFDKWHSEPLAVSFPDGETLEQVRVRVAAGLWDVYNRDSGRIAFVTHQVVSQVARCILEDRPLSDMWRDKLVNGRHITMALDQAAVERLRSNALGRAQTKEAKE
jgi:broad specificity phosphatase PhoE